MSLLLASTLWFSMDGREPHRTPAMGMLCRLKHQQCFGGHSERETPGHIPNPEAKALSADGTAGGTLWESRTPPDFFWKGAPERSGAPSSASGPTHAAWALSWFWARARCVGLFVVLGPRALRRSRRGSEASHAARALRAPAPASGAPALHGAVRIRTRRDSFVRDRHARPSSKRPTVL